MIVLHYLNYQARHALNTESEEEQTQNIKVRAECKEIGFEKNE